MTRLAPNSRRAEPLVVSTSDDSTSSHASTERVYNNSKKVTTRRSSLDSSRRSAQEAAVPTPKRTNRRSSLDSSLHRVQTKAQAQAHKAVPRVPQLSTAKTTSSSKTTTSSSSTTATATTCIAPSSKPSNTSVLSTSNKNKQPIPIKSTRRSSLDSAMATKKQANTAPPTTRPSRRASLESSKLSRSPQKKAANRRFSNNFMERLQQEMNTTAAKVQLETTNNTRHRPTRRVRFAPSQQNQYYDDACQLTQTQRQALYYTAEETAAWKSTMIDTVRDLASSQLQYGGYSYQSWSNCLLRAYHGLENNPERQTVLRIVACSQTTLSPSLVGLEKWVIKSLCNDRSTKRDLILARIRQVQQSAKWDAETKRHKIRLVSRAQSRPSRLYSQYIAQMAAHEYNALATPPSGR